MSHSYGTPQAVDENDESAWKSKCPLGGTSLSRLCEPPFIVLIHRFQLRLLVGVRGLLPDGAKHDAKGRTRRKNGRSALCFVSAVAARATADKQFSADYVKPDSAR